MIPCTAELVVVDRVEEGTAVVEIGERLLALEFGVAALNAARVSEGSRWQLCLLPSLPVASDGPSPLGMPPIASPPPHQQSGPVTSPPFSLRGLPR